MIKKLILRLIIKDNFLIINYMVCQNDWINSCCPQTTKDYVGYDSLIDLVKTWLCNYRKYSAKYKINIIDNINKYKEKKSVKKIKGRQKRVKKLDIPDDNRCCMLLTGCHGIGKTSLIKTIINELEYSPNFITFNDIATINNPEEYASDTLAKHSIQSMISSYKDEKRIIVVDNIESIKFPNERKFLSALIEENSKYWNFPIIFISDSKHNKFTNKNIKPYVYELPMLSPTRDDMLYSLSSIMNNKNIRMTKENAELILDKVKSDYRKLLSILEKLYCDTIPEKDGTIIITGDNIETCFSFYQSKDRQMDIYNSTNCLFSENISIDEALAIYETDKTLYPLMVQKNHISFIMKYSNKNANINALIEDVCDSLAKGDITENQIHCNQDYGLQKIQGYYSCVYTGKKICDTIKKGTKINIKTYKYLSNYNNESIKNINKNNYKKAVSDFKSMGIMDMLYAKEIIYTLISNDEHKKYEEVITGYNASSENILSLIKVDKVDKTKSIIPSTIIRVIKNFTE